MYVAGDFGPGKYWKDGNYISLGNTPGVGTGYIYVSNGSVFTTSEGKYWKDGTEFDLTKVSHTPALYSLVVFKDDVYIGGFAHKGDKLVACYWKNGKQIDITDGSNNAGVASIAVVGF